MTPPTHRTLFTSIGWTTLQNVFAKLVNLAAMAIITLYLRPDDLGVMAMVLVALTLVRIFIEQGLTDAMVQRPALSDAESSTAFWFTIITGAIFGITLPLLLPALEGIGFPADAVPYLRVSLYCLPILSAGIVPFALLKRSMAFKTIAGIHAAATIISSAAAILVAVNGHGIWALVTHRLGFLVCSAVVGTIRSRYRPMLSFSAGHLFAFWSYSRHLLAIYVIGSGYEFAEKYVFGAVFGIRTLGIYVFAQQLVNQLYEFVASASQEVALPFLARIRDDERAFVSSMDTLVRTVFVVAAPSFALLTIFAKDILGIFYGDTWNGSLPFLPWLSIEVLALLAYGLSDAALRSKGNMPVALRLSGLRFLLMAFTVALTVLLPLERIITVRAVAMILFIASAVGIHRHFTGWGIRSLGVTTFHAVTATAAMSLALVLLATVPAVAKMSTMMRIGGGMIGAVLLYGLSLFALTSAEERSAVRGSMTSLFTKGDA